MARLSLVLSVVSRMQPGKGGPFMAAACRQAIGPSCLRRIKHPVRTMLFTGLALFAALAVQPAAAQGYPSKPVKMVVPYEGGGIGDIVTRAVVTKIASNWGQPIVVEARPGANASIGTDSVAKSPADGYTWLLATLGHATNPSLQKNLPWHPTNDFAGAAMIGYVPALAVVPASIAANSLKEFIEYAKTKPGRINYLVPGFGTSMHLNTELLNLTAGVSMVPILYKGNLPGVPDLLSGQLEFAFMPVPLVVSHLKSGKLKAIATAAPKRIAQYPEVPTIAEAGFPDAQVVSWYTIVVPAKTPRDIVARINQEFAKALADPEVVKRLDNIGASVAAPMKPEELDAYLQAEVARWAKFVSQTKLERR